MLVKCFAKAARHRRIDFTAPVKLHRSTICVSRYFETPDTGEKQFKIVPRFYE